MIEEERETRKENELFMLHWLARKYGYGLITIDPKVVDEWNAYVSPM